LWTQADRVEPTPTTASKHAYYLLQEGRRDEAMALLQTIPNEERGGEVATVLGKAIYDAPTLSADEKMVRLEEEPVSPWRNYYLAALNAAAGRYDEANQLMRTAFSMNPRFGEDLPVIAAESEFFCRRAGLADCDAFIASVRSRPGAWDEERYRTRRAKLGMK
jgi:tetratricopeptide (TPR) repeat protein